MLGRKLSIGIFLTVLHAQGASNLTLVESPTQSPTAELRARIEAAPKLPLEQADLTVKLPKGEELGMVSWLAHDPKTGVTWLIQRGDKADPVLAVDKQGRILHSFGKGLYKIPHSIRLDPEGDIWTVDAGNSRIIKFSPAGRELLHFDVGGQPKSPESPFDGATDIAFAKGRIFISDGYANARILEYTAEGKKVREWGSAGSGPGQFHLPHSIAVDETGILYVADRENGRIEKFDLDGKFLGEIANLGRIYSLRLGTHGTMWAAMASLDQPPGSPGWIVKLDRTTGNILGYISVTNAPGLHCLDLIGDGQPMTDVGNKVILFKSPE
jgi:hypothetical protein